MSERSKTESVLRHIAPLLLTMAMIWSFALQATAQEVLVPDALEIILDAFESDGVEFTARLHRQPTPDRGSIDDPPGDFEHSTGAEPGFTPRHIDIVGTWALELDPGDLDLFTPTDANRFWAPTGRLEVDSLNHDPFHTFTGDQIHDGSQYAAGALLFGFTLADTPPVNPAGRCEYLVWVNDLASEATFVNNPNFPGDPAGDTNLAFGLGLNPVDGPGIQSGFALVLQESGGFARDFETDVRAFITPRYVGITVPRGRIGDLGAINFYSFCSEEGMVFEPEASGADQTGLVEITFEDFGALAIEALEMPTESTTATTSPSTTTTSTKLDDSAPGAVAEPVDEEPTNLDDGAQWWWFLIGGGFALALLGWWLHRQEDDPCAKLRDAWLVARKACDDARSAAERAADEYEEARLRLDSLEERRAQLCKNWPPACWPDEEGEWIEGRDGNRITSRDIHMRKVALGDVWTEYKAGKLTAGEVEARWRAMDTPEFREEMRETDDRFRQLLETIDADITEARGRLDEAGHEADGARTEADEACSRAESAREGYESCVESGTESSTHFRGAH